MHGSYPKLARREDRQDGRLRRARGCLDGRGGLLHTVVRTHARQAPASEGGGGGGFQRFRDVGHERSTIATWLQASGYRTGLFGKYLNGYPADTPTHVPPGWSAWS